jgi:hypothetical protein
MKKVLFFILTALIGLGSLQLSAQQIVEIGTGSTTTNSYLPLYSFYNNTLSEQIYTAAEVGMSGTITSIAFYNAGSTKTPDLKIYMINTNKTEFSSTTDWFTVTASDLVYDGTSVSLTAGQWTTIQLDNPFFYDGTSNLGLIVDAHLSYSSGLSCYVFSSTSNCAMYVYSDGTDYSAVGATYSASSRLSVKNHIKLEIIPGTISCHHVGNVSASGVTAYDATITWNTPEDAGTYMLQYKESTDDWTSSNVVTVYPNDTTYNFSGALSPITTYDVRVANLCSNGDTSMWRGTSFTTDCVPLTQLPYTQDFDNYGTGTATAYPPCWTKYSTYTASANLPYISATHYEGTGSLYLYVATSGTYNTAIAPEFDASIPINTLQASFMYRGTYATDRLIVGVMDSPTDPTSFVPVDTVVPSSTPSTWVEREVNFSQYTGSGQYIAFKNHYTTTNCYSYVDNLTIDLIPSCPRPQYVTLSNYTTAGCDVTWTPAGTESAWEVVAVPAGADPSTGTPESAYSIPYTLTTLSDDTQYDVYVRADCGNDYSAWSFKATFTTDPLCTSPQNVSVSQLAGTSAMVTWNNALFGASGYTVGYSEAGQGNWTIVPSVTSTFYMISGLTPNTSYDVFVLSECAQGDADTVFANFITPCLAGGDPFTDGTITTYNLPLNNYWNYSYTQQIFLASEINGVTTIDSVAFYYGYSTPSSAKSSVSIYMGHTSQSTFSSTSNYIPSTNLQQVYTGPMNCSQGWNTFVFTTPFQYNGTDNLVLVVDDNSGDYDGNSYVFLAHDAGATRSVHYYSDDVNPDLSDPTSGSPNMYTTTERSNVKFFMPCDNTITCVTPNLYVSGATDESITIGWAPGNTETSWEVEYSEDASTWTSEGVVTASPYTISNLTSNTLYYVRLRAVCGGGNNSGWASVNVRTACSDLATLPFLENFDSYTGATTTSVSTNNLPYCWSNLNEGTSTSYSGYPIIYASATYAASGSNSLRFYTYTTSGTYDDQIAILPSIDVDLNPMNTLQVALDVRDNTTSYPFHLDVGIMTDPTDRNTFVLIQTITTSSTTYANYEIPFSSYTGTGKYIALRASQPTSGYNYGYVDNVRVELIPECPKPVSVTSSAVTTNSVTLGWTETGTATSWVITYGPTGFTPGTTVGTTETVYDNPYTITGLSASTGYDFYVQSDCGGSYSNMSNVHTVSTECDVISALPFMENFDSYSGATSTSANVNNLPYCWSNYNTGTSTSYHGYPIIYSSATYAASGNNAMRFYIYTTSGTYSDQTAILPAIDVNTFPMNTLQLSFDARRMSSSYTFNLVVGVMTDPTNISTFVPVQTISVPSTTYSNYEVPFTSYTGTGSYIAIKAPQPSSNYNEGYIDNIVVDLTPLCDKPTNVMASNITATTADINWMPGGNETDWELVVVPSGMSIAVGTAEPVSTHPYTLTNLSDNTAYDVYVRADCGTGTDFSSWSQACHFTTTPWCSAPTNVEISQISGTSALVTWTEAVFGATGYTIAYTETGMNNWATQSVTGSPYMITGLTPETAYTMTITSDCDQGTAPAVTKTFSTGCLSGGDNIVGNGTTGTYNIPLNTFYNYSYVQELYLASEINNSGDINSIGFQYIYSTSQTKTNQSIYLAETDLTSLSTWIPFDSLTLVYSGSITYNNSGPGNWVTIPLTTPFNYSGNRNLVVVVKNDHGDYTTSSNNTFNAHSASGKVLQYYNDDGPFSFSSPESPSTYSSRNNIKFGMECDYTVTCIAPNVYVSNVTENSITLNWAAGNSESSWELETSMDNTTWTSEGTITTAPYTLSNLPPNTLYYIRMRSICGGGEYSNWATLSQRTGCAPIATLPFVENFDSYTGSTSTSVAINNLPYCWSYFNEGTSSSYSGYPIIYSSSASAASGNNSVRFYTYTTSGTYDDQTAILPAIDVNTLTMNTLQLSFDAKALSTSYPFNLEIGVMTDPTDMGTFMLISTVTTQSTTYANYEIPLNQYTGTGAYIAIKAPKPTANYNYGYLDNVMVDLIPACPKPTQLHASNVTTNSINLGWTEVGSATSWVIEYGPAGFTPGNGTTENASTNPYTITNLTASTTYDFYVKSDCGGGDFSNLSNVYSTTTACDAISALPYTENFDAYGTGETAYPNCWGKINTYSSNRPYVNSTHFAGVGSLYFYAGTSGTYNIAITPPFDQTIPVNTLQATFMYRSTYTSDMMIVGVMTNPTDASTFVAVDTIYPASTASTWVEKEVIFSQYQGTGQYIAFKNAYTSTYSYGYIDNLFIGLIPTCPKPTQVHVVSSSTSSIELGWTENGSATEWEIEYGPAGFTQGTGTVEPALTNPYTINNLTSSTTYDFYVRAVCGAGDTSYYAPVLTTSTECDAITQLPYTEGFDTYGTGDPSYPICWGKINTYSANRPYVNSTHYAGVGSLYFYAASATYNIAIVPQFDASIPVNTLQATFMYRAFSTTDYMIVGVMTNPNDANTFVPIDTIYPESSASTWVEKEVVFSGYTGTGHYIAFYNGKPTTTCYSYIDDLVIDLIPACPKPHNLHIVNATVNSIELGWTEVGSATSWEIVYGAPGFDPNGTTATTVTASTNPFTISNLNSTTTYEFYVRSSCGGSDVSYWSQGVQGSTTMTPESLPYTADFSANDAWVLNNGSCTNYWTKGTVSGTPALFVTDNGTTPNYTITSTSVVAAQKLFTIGTADSLTITFDVQVQGESSYDYMKLFLAPASAQFPASASSPSSGDYGYNTYSTNAYNFYAHNYGGESSSYPHILNQVSGTIHVVAKMPNPNVNPNASSTALMVFAWKNDSSVGTQPPATITNLSVTASGSAPVITNPTVATNSATAITTTGATLHATITNPDNVTITAKGFQWKATQGGTYTSVNGTGTGNGFSADLSNLTPSTSYTYKAFITYNGQTVTGNEMTFTTSDQGSEPCDVPTNLHTTDIQNESISIAWDANPNVNSWNIQYRPVGGQLSSASSNTNNYTITGLTMDTEYEIQVQAVCANGSSDWTSSITAHTTNVGIENWLSNSVSLYPNPAKEYVDIRVDGELHVKMMEVYDVYGKLINTVNVIDNPTRINVSGLANGMYFVRVTTEEGTVTKTFVKR